MANLRNIALYDAFSLHTIKSWLCFKVNTTNRIIVF